MFIKTYFIIKMIEKYYYHIISEIFTIINEYYLEAN